MICAFLIEQFELSVETALSLFAEARSPGIYKQNYINELFKRYGNGKEAPQAPEQPGWDDGEVFQGGGKELHKLYKLKVKNRKDAKKVVDEENVVEKENEKTDEKEAEKKNEKEEAEKEEDEKEKDGKHDLSESREEGFVIVSLKDLQID